MYRLQLAAKQIDNLFVGLSLICLKFYQLLLPALPKNSYPSFLFYSHIITYYSHIILYALLFQVMTSRETWIKFAMYLALAIMQMSMMYICHCMYMFNLPLILIFNIYQLHHACETCYNSKIVPVNASPLIPNIMLAKIVIYRYFLKLCWHVRLRSIPVLFVKNTKELYLATY